MIQMMKINRDKFFEELDKGLGEGPLCLMIYCTNCDTQFEISKEGATMSILLKRSFIDYLRWVQSSTCSKCGVNNNKKDEEIEENS